MVATSSKRWRPTPKQLMILEELFMNGAGLKSPNSTQIERITSYLSQFGKIQYKNVFYWFQNHKARYKLKLKKRLHFAKHIHSHSSYNHCHFLNLQYGPTRHIQHSSCFLIQEHARGGYHRLPPLQTVDFLNKVVDQKDDAVTYEDDTRVTVSDDVDPALDSGPSTTLDLFPSTSASSCHVGKPSLASSAVDAKRLKYEDDPSMTLSLSSLTHY